MKDYKGAIEDYSKFLDIAGEFYVYNNRGDAKKQLKDYDGAIEDYKSAIYTAYNNYEFMTEVLKKIIDLNPNDPDIQDIIDYINELKKL